MYMLPTTVDRNNPIRGCLHVVNTDKLCIFVRKRNNPYCVKDENIK